MTQSIICPYCLLPQTFAPKPSNPPGEVYCPNCGGRGFLSTFVSNKGPFNHPGSGKDDLSHYYDGKWWVGNTITASCPVCKGTNPDLQAPDEQPATHGRRQTVAEVARGYYRGLKEGTDAD